MQRVELLQALPRAENDGLQRLAGRHDRHAGLVGQPLVEPFQECPAAGEPDASLHDVRGELRGCLVERVLHSVDDRLGRFLDGLSDLGRGQHDRLGKTGDEIATSDLGGGLVCLRPRRRHCHLQLLCGALTQEHVVFFLHPVDDGLVQLVTAHTDGSRHDDPSEGDDCDLGGAAADVDHHRA